MAEDDEVVEPGLSGRSFWSGSITFGLVSVPVALFPATRPRSFSMRIVDAEGATVRRRYVCSKDGKELDDDEIVRGYEIEKGTFVVVTDDELEAIEPRKTREIDLQLFVHRDAIDPIYFERAYFLAPTGGSNKAYRLLAETMESGNRAGIATFVMRAKEYLVAIIAENGILRAETLRFADEIRKPGDVGLPKKTKPKPADVKKFETAIGNHSGKVDFSEFLDDYAERLEELAEEKKKRGEDVVKATKEAKEDEEGGEVVDLLEVLRKSLGNTTRPRRTAAKTARKPSKRKKRSTR
ncbi:MAG: non-homologous end joining protein Ku [Thermoanaerobaculia bacterium]